jgi:ribonuclease HII
MILAGIDEAGLGPVLGPLVVSATAFRLAGEAGGDLCGPDLWSLLGGSVVRKKSQARRAGAIVVGDSKKLFSRKAGGLVQLERGVWTMLSCRAGGHKLPRSLGELFDTVAPGAQQRAGSYPWYGSCELPLPAQASAIDIELRANALRVAMLSADLSLLSVRAEPVFVGDFNKLIAATNNKSTATLDITSRSMMRICRASPSENMRIIIDRQGGRVRYRPQLQRLFPGCELKIVEECGLLSAYRITAGQRRVEVVFRVGAEEASLPVALASMLSKYIRELCMECFNRFWARHVPDIKPTAGYYVDGRRFYGEITRAMDKANIDPAIVYRIR